MKKYYFFRKTNKNGKEIIKKTFNKEANHKNFYN